MRGMALATHTLLLLIIATACGGPLDVGRDNRGPLPVGRENAVILLNDSVYDNWQGEYALLLANGGGPELLGIVVSTGGLWMDLDANVAGWEQLTESARASGFANVATPVASQSTNLQRPADDDIDATISNESIGAMFIVEESQRVFDETSKPVVVAVGGRFTDVADAYLMDPTVTQRVIVVASAGSTFGGDGVTAALGRPNGEMDPWASSIVIDKFTYIQVGAHYDQLLDVPEARVGELPEHPLGTWIAAKRTEIAENPVASDQVSVLAGGVDGFASEFARVSPTPIDDEEPSLVADTMGDSFLVSVVDGTKATTRFWKLLLETK